MNVLQRRDRDRRLVDAADELIRRRFRSCESLPLFPEPAPPPRREFFDPPDTGRQLRLLDLRPERRG
jgi:hypothetical protein